MKVYSRVFLTGFLFLSLCATNYASEWEMISPDRDIRDLVKVDDTWFGIERIQNGTIVQMLLVSSTDKGQTWNTSSYFSEIFQVTSNGSRILLRASKDPGWGYFISDDKGATWKKLLWPFVTSGSDIFLTDSAIFITVAKNQGVTSPVYRSLDDGDTFHPLNIEVGDRTFGFGRNFGNFSLHNKKLYVFVGRVGVFASEDNGDTWELKNSGLPFSETDYEYTIGVLSKGAPELYLYFGDIGATYLASYKYQNGTWVIDEPDTYYYEPYYDDYRKTTPINPSPTAARSPHMFTISSAYSIFGSIHYSVDNGKTWFKLQDTGIGSVYWNAMLIDGGYIYAGTTNGFARISLSKAVNHNVKLTRQSINEGLPVSPEEMASLLSLLGAEGVLELLEDYGFDTDEISNDELSAFLSDYTTDNGISNDLFGNSQPGTCSFMGMPVWSVNVANLKLFLTDMLFRKKGLGPELKLACNYLHTSDTSAGIFGKKWRFSYESALLQKDSLVILTTGTGARFIFTNGTNITTGATEFTLPCLNNRRFLLHWNGSEWVVEKNRGAEINRYVNLNDSVYVLSSLEDPYDKKITLGYNGNWQPALITDGAGRNYRLTYLNNLVDSIVLPDGRFASFTYADGYLTNSTDFAGITTSYTYDSMYNISSAVVSGKSTMFDYDYSQDTAGMLSAVFDPENRKIAYHSSFLDSSTIFTSVTYPGSKTRAYEIKNGLVTAIINSNGETKKIFYNDKNLADSLLWYNGTAVLFEYDPNGNIISKKDLRNNTTNYTYDVSHNLLAAVRSTGDTIFSRTYNSNNQLESIKLPGNKATIFEYDPNGALSAVINPEGHTNNFGRDEYGNINSYTNPAGDMIKIQYGEFGFFPVSQTDFNGNIYQLVYDNNGKLETITMPDGNTRQINYDCCAQTGFTDENGNTYSAERDNTGRILSMNYAEGWSLGFTYNENGLISGFTGKYGMNETYKYNDKGMVVSRSNEDGQIIYQYNELGQTESITDKNGNSTRFSYDTYGKLSVITDAAGNNTMYEFDANNRLVSLTNARGIKTENVYAENGLVTEKKIGTTTYVSYEYDNNGLLTAYSDSRGITRYTRNSMGFVTKISYPGNLEVDFTHDKNGNITGITYPDGTTLTATTDQMNRISGISWDNKSIDYTYNPAGYTLAETRSNNTNTAYNYNKDNILIDVIHFKNEEVIASENVTYLNGVVSEIEVHPAIEISDAPKQISATTVNNLNQLVSAYNGYTFSYDADGNMIHASDGESDILSASYSHENLISTFRSSDANASISYDAMRYPRQIISDNTVTRLFYDHKGRLLFETDAEGTVTVLYFYKGRKLVAMQTSDKKAYFFHLNRLGHVVALTDENSLTLNKYAYSASGEILGKSESLPNRFTFLGGFGALRLTDDFILAGMRVYHPVTGRFIQRDPFGMITGTNQYLYARNNPVAGIDPLGLDDQETTVNTLDFDPPCDNDYGTAGGTANPYADNLPHRSNNWDTYGSAAVNTIKDITNHPLFDLVPDFIALPVSGAKAIDKLAEGDVGGAFWQFMPFNNSLEAAGDYINEELKYIDSSKSSGLGIFGEFNMGGKFTCDL